ncbi:2OG-Fe dioxygenase family protein [Nocardia arizonensis]|uniref:2OG-Fe dioxygenase family protein n=1 Tax=Nocardia arizonensis TaxID=1141647 RepID=UPI0006D2A614|nr:2OG-Fe dioxygenase family protein [Nocardia arizonensis]
MSARIHPPARDRFLQAAGQALVSDGAHFMPAAITRSLLGATADDLDRFRTHWERLSPDRYALARGTRRLRRYGHLSLTTATTDIRYLRTDTFLQPQDSNPLYIGTDRRFEPLTDAFTDDPVFMSVLRLLRPMATALDDAATWDVKVHPFRVIASADAYGYPAPEGRHRDGVTLVSSLLLHRDNATGGESSVYDVDGAVVLRTTLRETGDLLVGDDRRTLHDVSPVRPTHPERPGYRDVLVVTFTPA